MARGSFFVQTQEDALRHVNLLAKGLEKVAIAGMIGGAACGVMAVLLGRLLVTEPQSNTVPGFHEISGVTFVAAFMATGLIVFSGLYFLAGWGLSHRRSWARDTAAATFLAKLLLCVWLGRSSLGAMVLFLMVAAWDIYGLWVLLSKETGQLFTSSQTSSPQISQSSDKPANLVT
ncbi:MAG: hypothetical protein ABSG13_24790 [Bryobacteraceae bacterium]|jgi:hypothetical protein